MTTEEINEISIKINYLDDLLKKEIFKNPLKEVQENIRNEVIDFKTSFFNNLEDLDTHLVKFLIIIRKLLKRKGNQLMLMMKIIKKL